MINFTSLLRFSLRGWLDKLATSRRRLKTEPGKSREGRKEGTQVAKRSYSSVYLTEFKGREKGRTLTLVALCTLL